MNIKRVPVRPLLVLVACCSLGCGGSAGPEIARVSGTVTLDGEPLERGTVYFTPNAAAGTSGPTAIGQIGPDGKYELTTTGDRNGAVPGKHRVRIEARAEPKDRYDTQPAYIIPAHYDDPAKSGLTAIVVPGKDNVIDFPLSSEK